MTTPVRQGVRSFCRYVGTNGDKNQNLKRPPSPMAQWHLRV